MIIKVGTNNPIKVKAVKECLCDYSDFNGSQVVGVNVSSGVSNQPRSAEETVGGALNRAVNAFLGGADLGIGLESGLTNSPLGWMNFTAAVICESSLIADFHTHTRTAQLWERAWENGIHFGHSTSFPLPHNVVNKILHENMELDEAVYACNLVDVPNIGKIEGGFLGVLTKGRISRMAYSKQALQMALISYENKEIFMNSWDQEEKEC